MEFFFGGKNGDNGRTESIFGQEAEKCPFLRNIIEPTSFSFSPSPKFPAAVRSHAKIKETRGPIFEDGPNFEMAFRLFHGRDGVIPLLGRSSVLKHSETEAVDSAPSACFHPLAAPAATISLSAFGPGGPFSFGNFMGKGKGPKDNKKKADSKQNSKSSSSHEALGTEWLETGKCPIAKSYQAVSHVLPLVAKVFQPPPGMKFKCPPAVVAARAALARTALAKSLRPKPLSAKLFAIGLLGMAANIPLGVWREHTQKFSPSWFIAIHAAVPFIAMLRKAVLMPKSAMAFTIAASVLGQVIGSRAERLRLKSVERTTNPVETTSNVIHQTSPHINAEIKTLKPIRACSCVDKEDDVNPKSGTEAWETLKSPRSSVGTGSYKGICF